VGSDSPQLFATPGFGALREMDALVAAGLSRYDALVAATRAPAEYLGWTRDAGTIAVGKRADLVLLDGNPLSDLSTLRRPAGVMVGGRWLDRTRLDALLDGVALAAARVGTPGKS
jgi:imidazolonepropionase-like amidohydrolase